MFGVVAPLVERIGVLECSKYENGRLAMRENPTVSYRSRIY